MYKIIKYLSANFSIITEEKHPKKGTLRGAHPVGFEPTTFRSVAERSIQLSYGCIIFNSINSYKLFIHRDPYFTDAGGRVHVLVSGYW